MVVDIDLRNFDGTWPWDYLKKRRKKDRTPEI